ncbi:hypothetical protein HC031_21895 [Planosporangium thailandense]|uniref:Uncharacterized protein n=1 Tax=Planosporangium thailandense TaxID=765197 RepID=A0ABX0Y4X8_9ACTN|nr:hypothetical protein [Planosporangium thailandense]NJC72349.1 hypothetical protein [Planosporangium thailandense]
MTAKLPRLKALLVDRHWQTYRTFCQEYDRVARCIDSSLVGMWPSRAQFHRWLSGELKGLPYPDACRILEAMFPGWRAEELFAVGPIDLPARHEPTGQAFAARSPDAPTIHPDLAEEDNRAVARRIRSADEIFFAAHTGYAAMVSQYQSAVRCAIANGARLRVVVSDPDGPLMAEPELTTRLCPSIRQAGEIEDVLFTCGRHRATAVDAGYPEENVQARVYMGPPSMNILLVDGWLRLIPYLPLVDAADSPVYEFALDSGGRTPLIAKYFIAVERLWAGSRTVDLAAIAV